MLRKIGLILMLAFISAAAGGVSAALAQDNSLSVYKEPDLPDPVANNGVHFDPALATAGTAVAGAPVTSIKPGADCKPSNSCAVPPPALQALTARR